MSAKVNLDALIPREDFEVTTEAIQHQQVQTLQIRDLESEAFFYSVLRKPDFQRETADWSPEKICELIQSFLNGDLIPAVILWQHTGSYIFIIDGAHRLSALIAWVHDDYGDGQLSKLFFDQRIPEEQLDIAERTRRLIQRKIGSYEDHKFAIRFPEKSKVEQVEVAKRLASLSLQLQWVRGNANQAQASFFKINQQAAPIDQTELKLLQSRKKPNAMSARAIIRSGTGHKYWSKFEEDKQQIIEQMAKEINAILFTPTLHTPIKTLDLPVAGKGYSAETLPLVFELVNLTNNVRSEKQDKLSVDNDGIETIQYLKETRKIVYRISGTHPSSLGLHPVVYFYSATGRYQPTAFLAIVGLIMDFVKRDYFNTFTEYRRKFEDFLLAHKSFANQVTWKLGSGVKGFGLLQNLYQTILDSLIQDKNETEVLEDLVRDSRFSFLKLTESDGQNAEHRHDFDTAAKSTVFLREALKNPLRCRICDGLIHLNSISVDHIQRKADGGLATIDNGQLTHPYCNTTFKN